MGAPVMFCLHKDPHPPLAAHPSHISSTCFTDQGTIIDTICFSSCQIKDIYAGYKKYY